MISLLFRIWQSLVSLRFNFDARQQEILKALQSLQEGQQAIAAQLVQISDTLIPGPAVALVLTAHLDDGTFLNEVTQMDLRDDQKVLLTIAPVDVKGKPALIDGVPVWAGSDDTVVTIVAASDGLSAVATGVSTGTARVVVTADADLGSGVTPITGSLDFTITGGSAATIAITAGTPANQ